MVESIDDERDPPNRRLFHYLSLGSPERQGWAQQTFLRHELYFPSPTRFNDPFDCKVPPLEAIPKEERKEFMRQWAQKHLSDKKGVERKQVMRQLSTKSAFKKSTEFLQENVDACGVLCMSTQNDDILMWSHYADSHRGICLEFAALATRLFGEAQPVGYVDVYTPFPLSDDDEQARRVLLTKSSHWAYEREWRVIKRSRLVNNRLQHAGDRAYQFDLGDLKAVIFGCQASPESVAMVSGWIAQGRCEVKRYRARRKSREYGLDIISVK